MRAASENSTRARVASASDRTVELAVDGSMSPSTSGPKISPTTVKTIAGVTGVPVSSLDIAATPRSVAAAMARVHSIGSVPRSGGDGLVAVVRAGLPRLALALLFGLERVRGSSLGCLLFEALLDLEQLLPPRPAHGRELRVDLHQGMPDHGQRGDPPEPLAVGGNHVPRRPLGAGVREHLREDLLVLVPVGALLHVAGGELPVVVGQVEAAQEARALLLLGQIEEQLHDAKPVAGEVALPGVALAVGALPDGALPPRPGELLAIETLGMAPHQEPLLKMGAVEDPDPPAPADAARSARESHGPAPPPT